MYLCRYFEQRAKDKKALADSHGRTKFIKTQAARKGRLEQTWDRREQQFVERATRLAARFPGAYTTPMISKQAALKRVQPLIH